MPHELSEDDWARVLSVNLTGKPDQAAPAHATRSQRATSPVAETHGSPLKLRTGAMPLARVRLPVPAWPAASEMTATRSVGQGRTRTPHRRRHRAETPRSSSMLTKPCAQATNVRAATSVSASPGQRPHATPVRLPAHWARVDTPAVWYTRPQQTMRLGIVVRESPMHTGHGVQVLARITRPLAARQASIALGHRVVTNQSNELVAVAHVFIKRRRTHVDGPSHARHGELFESLRLEGAAGLRGQYRPATCGSVWARTPTRGG